MLLGYSKTVVLTVSLAFMPMVLAIPASELFEQGIFAEETAGNLAAAIEIYEQIVEDREASDAYLAQAYYRLGLIYFKQGKDDEARAAFRKVIKEYPGQASIVTLATSNLNLLVATQSTAEFNTENNNANYTLTSILSNVILSWSDLKTSTMYDYSPDGESMVFSGTISGVMDGKLAPLGLYIADKSGNQIRPLLESWGPRHGSSLARWSPDGKLIAFTARNRVDTGSDYEFPTGIYLIDPNGGMPYKIGNDVMSMVGGLSWTVDGQHLTYITAGGGKDPNGVNTINIHDNSIEFIPVDFRAYGRAGDYSPDGRWLLLEIQNNDSESTDATDEWILPSNGGRALQITNESGFDGHPEWSPDGSAISFLSDRIGELNLWKQRINLQTGIREGVPEQVTFFNNAKVMHPQLITNTGQMAFVIAQNTSSLHLAEAADMEQVRSVGRGVKPLLSPEGDLIYYIGEGSGQQGIFAWEKNKGVVRKLSSHVPVNAIGRNRALHLSPNGETLAYFVRVEEKTQLFLLDTTSGEANSILTINAKEQSSPAWSPDGKYIAYASGDGVYKVAVTGGRPQKLAHMYLWDSWTVRWSPDGEHLAALGWRGPEDSENSVFVIPSSGGEPQALSNNTSNYKEGLEWHPDSKSVTYFQYGQELTLQAYIDGRTPTVLFDQEDAWEYLGKWSPDGSKYYFMAAIGKIWNTYVYDLESGKIDSLNTHSEGDVTLLHWNKDGKSLTWSTTRKTGQLWLMDNYR